MGSRWQVRCPSDVADRLTLQLGTLEREELHVLVLNTRNVVIYQERVYQGNVSASVVRVGELFRRAVERHGSAIILCHNHPSGEVKPSLNDLQLTTDAIRAGRLLDITVLDHLIVGGGTFSSVRDYGVTFDRPGADHAARERRAPSWRDSRYGTYKSALQKYIRRGEIDKAVGVGAALAELPGGRSMLGRRLTVIAAEDVGWQFIPATGRVAQECQSLADSEAVPGLLRAVASLASLPKSKDAYWLAATCWDGRRIPEAVTGSALERALLEGRHQDATAICLAAREQRAWRSGLRLIETLRAALTTAPELAQEVGRWALWREAQGGFGTSELVAAAIIAVIDQPDGLIPELPKVAYEHPVGPAQLAWYCFDSHVPAGAKVLAAHAKRLGMRTDSLGWLMFNESSLQLGPTEVPSRWKTEALQLDAIAGGWGTPAEGSMLWVSVRDAIRADIDQTR